MQINEQFTVDMPLADVWEMFKDVPEVARCLPGAELLADNGDGTYDGRVTVKLGPITSTFDGTATVTFDDASTSLKLNGRGVDKAGGSQGRVDVDVSLQPEADATAVSIESKATLAGPIAQFGRTGLVNEVSKRLIGEFADCLHAKLEAETAEEAAQVEAAPVKGLTLFFAGLAAAIAGWWKRLVGSSEKS